MKFRASQVLCWSCLAVTCGCGGGPPEPKLADPIKVQGTISLDDKPLASAIVYFVPDGGKNMGNGATGITNANGVYELVTTSGARKKSGAIPGNYKVTVSRLVRNDGTTVVPDAGTPPANLGAVESIPSRYSDVMQTELKANVSSGSGPLDFSIASQ